MRITIVLLSKSFDGGQPLLLGEQFIDQRAVIVRAGHAAFEKIVCNAFKSWRPVNWRKVSRGCRCFK